MTKKFTVRDSDGDNVFSWDDQGNKLPASPSWGTREEAEKALKEARLIVGCIDPHIEEDDIGESEAVGRALAVGGDPEPNLEAEKIYEVVMSEDFRKWYETYFEDHVTGEEGCKSKEEILETIKEIFSLPDTPDEPRKFNLTIDADETFLEWLFENFDGEVQNEVSDLNKFKGTVVAEIEDANEGRWQKNMPLVKIEDGRVGWHDPDDNSISFSKGPVNLEKMFADLEAHEERQVHEEEEELND